MVLSTFPTFPGCLIKARPIATLRLIDSDRQDDKVIAVPKDDPRFSHVKELKDLNPHFKKEIKNFWENYAELQKEKKIKIVGWQNTKPTYQLIQKAIKNYQNQR